MIIDVHAHALSERFIRDLATTPVAGLKSETGPDGYYAIRRAGDDRKSTLDPHLFDLEHRLAKDRKFNATCRSIFSPGRSCQTPISHGKAAESARKPPVSHLRDCL